MNPLDNYFEETQALFYDCFGEELITAGIGEAEDDSANWANEQVLEQLAFETQSALAELIESDATLALQTIAQAYQAAADKAKTTQLIGGASNGAKY